MSQGLFKAITAVNVLLKKMSWLTAPVYYMVNRIVPTQSKEDLSWRDEVDAAILEQTPLRAKKILYAILVIVTIAIVWAWFAKVEEVTRGDGRVGNIGA
jgi:membrane fusion protein, adhesin transport system